MNDIPTVVGTGLDHWISISNHIPISVAEIESRLNELQGWCTDNLTEGKWHFKNFVSVTDWQNNKMIFANQVVFSCEQDATAFRLTFKL